MKKLVYLSAIAAVALFSLTSCDKSLDDGSTYDSDFEAIAETFYTNTLKPTYSNLATYSDNLVSQLEAFQAKPSQTALNTVCSTFLNCRAQWELSEAFLFGAATDFGIDPHMDSWPLDEDAFNRLMDSPKILAGLAGEDGDTYAGDNLGNALLGFHGIEYIIFENGAPKTYSKITADQITYAVAVAGDLRNHTWQLEVAWLGDEAPAAHAAKVEDLEFNTTVNGGDNSYGANLLGAGKAGSTLASWTAAMQYIIQGGIDIADEVGSSKIGKPNSGEDPSYIESPYSWNSITDFYDNISSIYNVYYGGVEGNRVESKSLHAFLSKHDSALDAKIVAALDDALKQIGKGKNDSGEGMVYPFVNNVKDASVAQAIEACNTLVDVLDEARTAIAQY